MKLTIALLMTLTMLGCTGPREEEMAETGPTPDAGDDATEFWPDAAMVTDDTSPVEEDSLPSDSWVDPTPITADCSLVPLANVYEPGTARLTASFFGVDPDRLVIYLDGIPISRGSWRLADDGHTLVVTQGESGGHVVAFSIGCTRSAW